MVLYRRNSKTVCEMSKLKRYNLGALWGNLEVHKGTEVYLADEVDTIIPKWISVDERLPEPGKKIHMGTHDIDGVWYETEAFPAPERDDILALIRCSGYTYWLENITPSPNEPS